MYECVYVRMYILKFDLKFIFKFMQYFRMIIRGQIYIKLAVGYMEWKKYIVSVWRLH